MYLVSTATAYTICVFDWPMEFEDTNIIYALPVCFNIVGLVGHI